jgi:hypothetical protein
MIKTCNRLEIAFWDLAILLMTESPLVQSVVRAGNSIKNLDLSNSKSRQEYLLILIAIGAIGLLVGVMMGLMRTHP